MQIITGKKLNKTLPWVDISTKQLIIKGLPKKKYYYLGHSFDPKTQQYNRYLVLTDNKNEAIVQNIVRTDNYGRAKLSVFSIWDYTTLCTFDKNTNIKMEQIESKEDPDDIIYKLDI